MAVTPCCPLMLRPRPGWRQASSEALQGRLTSSNVYALPSWRYGAVFHRSTRVGVT